MPPNSSFMVSPSPALDVSQRKSTEKGSNIYDVLSVDPDNERDSQTFFGLCLMLGSSTILQSRRAFPGTCFRRKTIPGVCKTMVPAHEDEIGGRIFRRLKSAARTLTLGYLKEFIIVISNDDDDPHKAIEVYTWSFAYNDGEVTASLTSEDNMAGEIQFSCDVPLPQQLKTFLFRMRALCRSIMKPLPPHSYGTFKLVYTDDAPEGFQAEGYQPAPKIYDLDPAARGIVVSTMGNDFHKVAVLTKSVCIDDEFVTQHKLDDARLSSRNDSMMLDATFSDETAKKEQKAQLRERNNSKRALETAARVDDAHHSSRNDSMLLDVTFSDETAKTEQKTQSRERNNNKRALETSARVDNLNQSIEEPVAKKVAKDIVFDEEPIAGNISMPDPSTEAGKRKVTKGRSASSWRSERNEEQNRSVVSEPAVGKPSVKKRGERAGSKKITSSGGDRSAIIAIDDDNSVIQKARGRSIMDEAKSPGRSHRLDKVTPTSSPPRNKE